MRTYHGERSEDGCTVTVDGRPLPMQSSLSGNATTQFDWGFIGNGQLSLALLADVLGDGQQAKALYEAFEEKVISKLPKTSWTMTDDDVAAALAPLMSDAKGGGPVVEGDGAGTAFGDMPIRTADVPSPPT